MLAQIFLRGMMPDIHDTSILLPDSFLLSAYVNVCPGIRHGNDWPDQSGWILKRPVQLDCYLYQKINIII